MALSWDALESQYPEVALQASVLARTVQAVRRLPAERVESIEFVAPVAREFGLRDRSLGVGVIMDANDDRPVPAIFGDFGIGAWEEVHRTSMQLQLGATDTPRNTDVTLVSLPRADAFAGPGEKCIGPTFAGTCGARVTATDGTNAMLVAGHVAEQKGTAMHGAGGALLGTVTACLTTEKLPPQQAGPDVALVPLDPSADDTGLAHASTLANATPRSYVEIHGFATGVSNTWIRGISAWWTGPDPKSGDWGYVLITRDGVTAGGDSGGPALLKGTDEIVGHVVGGSPGVYSLIQEIDYQLGTTPGQVGATVGLSGVKLR